MTRPPGEETVTSQPAQPPTIKTLFVLDFCIHVEPDDDDDDCKEMIAAATRENILECAPMGKDDGFDIALLSSVLNRINSSGILQHDAPCWSMFHETQQHGKLFIKIDQDQRAFVVVTDPQYPNSKAIQCIEDLMSLHYGYQDEVARFDADEERKAKKNKKWGWKKVLKLVRRIPKRKGQQLKTLWCRHECELHELLKTYNNNNNKETDDDTITELQKQEQELEEKLRGIFDELRDNHTRVSKSLLAKAVDEEKATQVFRKKSIMLRETRLQSLKRQVQEHISRLVDSTISGLFEGSMTTYETTLNSSNNNNASGMMMVGTAAATTVVYSSAAGGLPASSASASTTTMSPAFTGTSNCSTTSGTCAAAVTKTSAAGIGKSLGGGGWFVAANKSTIPYFFEGTFFGMA